MFAFYIKETLEKGGYGNGYVDIPKGNFLHGLHYDKITELLLNERFSLTYSNEHNGLWRVGFNTWSSNDLHEIDKDYIYKHTKALSKALFCLCVIHCDN